MDYAEPRFDATPLLGKKAHCTPLPSLHPKGGDDAAIAIPKNLKSQGIFFGHQSSSTTIAPLPESSRTTVSTSLKAASPFPRLPLLS